MRLRRSFAALAPLLFLLGACQAAAPSAPAGDDGTGAAGLDAPVPGLRTIAEVQGREGRSPLLDHQVTVRGVVVGNFAKGLQGVFIQSQAPDEDNATSDGLFVQRRAEAQPEVHTGDLVEVSGTVVESGDEGRSLTSLKDAVVTVLGKGRVEAIVLNDPPLDWERFEGMLLRINMLTVTGNDSVASYGEIRAAFGGRLFQPTELAAPGPRAQAIDADNARRLLLLDDARTSKDPRNLWFLPEPLAPATPLRAGAGLGNILGVLDQRRGEYRLQLTEKLAVEHAERPRGVPQVRGDVRVASFNLHNLFNGDGRGAGFPTERGAKTREEFQRQQAKLVASVQALAPDIAVLMEVENDGSGKDSTLAQFVAALNQAGPIRDYRWLDTGDKFGNDAIRVAMIYRKGAATPTGRFATLTDGPFVNRSRAPLTQLFRLRDGHRLQLTAVHLKSKGCGRAPDQAQGADADQGDGQACWNPVRVESVRRLLASLDTDPLGAGEDTTRILIGDFNAYAQEDPLRPVLEAGWSDAFARDPKMPQPYSFVFGGLAGRLDHAFVDEGADMDLVGAEEWHANADEPAFFDYHNEASPGPWRASDHDPILIGLQVKR